MGAVAETGHCKALGMLWMVSLYGTECVFRSTGGGCGIF